MIYILLGLFCLAGALDVLIVGAFLISDFIFTSGEGKDE